MTSHQTQPSLSPFPGNIFAKRSNSTFETSKPTHKAWRTVGGIDEAPLHPKHTQHPVPTTTTTTHLFHSRLFSKAQHLTALNQSAGPRNTPPSRNPSLSFTRTHKSNFSDSTAASYQHLSKPAIPSYHHSHSFDQPPIYLHEQLPPASHSVVASLGLAPISNSIPSRHPFNLRPLRIPKDPFNFPPHPSSNHTPAAPDPFSSLPKLPSIPSLLNPERANSLAIDQPHTHRNDAHRHTHRNDDPPSEYTKLTYSSYDAYDTPGASLEITASDQPLLPMHALPAARSISYPTEVRPSHPIPRSSESLPRWESPVMAEMSDTHSPVQIESSVLPPLENDLPRNQSNPLDETRVFFEPAGKVINKYATPKPHLKANIPPQQRNLIVQSINTANHRDNQPIKAPGIHPSIPTSEKRCSNSSLEELSNCYWNSKGQNHAANEVWAEIYISRLERKIWKSEAEAEVSVDCLKFCTALKFNNKSKQARRRTSSAPNLKQCTPFVDRRGNKTQHNNTRPAPLRSVFDHTPLRKPFPIAHADSSSKAHVRQPASATRHRASSAPRPFADPRGIRSEAANHGPKITPESGYRIIIPNAPNAATRRNPKTLRRRFRSVPNLRERRVGTFDSSHGIDQTGQPYYSADQQSSLVNPIPSANPRVPQSLLDAMFPTPLESKDRSERFPPGELTSVRSSNRHLIPKVESAVPESHSDDSSAHHPDFTSEIIQATETGPKGPLHSLPRCVEPRSNVIIALPPPPRKRTVTPVTSTDSPNGTSTLGNKRSTGQSTPSHESWEAPSLKIHSNSLSPSPSKLNRRVSPALTIRNNLLKSTSDHSGTDPLVLPRFSVSIPELRVPSRPRSLSFVHQTSPSIRSGVDSGKRLSGFASNSSSRRCSLDLQSALIDDQYGLSHLPVPSYTKPPLSAFCFSKSTPWLDSAQIPCREDNTSGQEPDDDQRAADTQRRAYAAMNHCSSLSSPSGSSHSVIDPDVYIDQANLFYQMPATPRRDLIEDYDNRVFKSKQTTDNAPGPSLPASTPGKQARLIDQILAGYNAEPRGRIATDPNERQVPASRDSQPGALDSSNPDRGSVVSSEIRRRSSAIYRIPDIVDAFEARLSGILPNDEGKKERGEKLNDCGYLFDYAFSGDINTYHNETDTCLL